MSGSIGHSDTSQQRKATEGRLGDIMTPLADLANTDVDSIRAWGVKGTNFDTSINVIDEDFTHVIFLRKSNDA